ncbi:MAG: hypothetical protein A3K03_03875 [Bdellovibrionales bacterium RIFOXYD1_FULL_44_7]|nr:MAG: hypothetical protein A3K03_03875 [Bdellovibrionales bacterium RIFOXYD1_FULL_44_7]
MGSVDRIPRRKYHSLLTVREPGYGDPLNVLAEVGEILSFGQNSLSLHSISYGSQTYPQGFKHLIDFTLNPIPRWTYKLDGFTVQRSLELDDEQDIVRIGYEFSGIRAPVTLLLEPYLACRPIHQLTKENPFLNGLIRQERDGVSIEPYPPLPRLFFKLIGRPSVFDQAGRWQKSVFYALEHARGYPDTEDLYCPGSFRTTIKSDCTIVLHLGASELTKSKSLFPKSSKIYSFSANLKKVASQFITIKKNGTPSIVAGYPWLDESGRDTMICVPGLCLSLNQTGLAKKILDNYGNVLMKSTVQNAPSLLGRPQNVMLDASLFFIRAVQLLGEKSGKTAVKPYMPIVYHILDSLKQGVDSRVKVTDDGGLFVEAGSYAMTWMDASVHGQPVTPRHGYAVEINALFYNALSFALNWAKEHKHSGFANAWKPITAVSKASFMKRFWSEKFGYLADVHNGITADFSLRPNQLWALALPYSPVPKKEAQRALEKIKQYLFTPLGLRTLASADAKYYGQYRGNEKDRDLACHQGSIWPWLLGVYTEANINLLGIRKTRGELKPVIERLEQHFNNEACISQVSELFEGDEPHTAEGAPARAWSVAELIRVQEMLRED